MASESRWLLLLLTCAASTEVLSNIIRRPSCTTGWFYHKSNCYGYFRKLRNWSEAEVSQVHRTFIPEIFCAGYTVGTRMLECQSYGNGAHLASILNPKEARVIAEYISSYQRNQPVWIGLHDPLKKQQWQWIDGALYLYRTWSGRSLDGSKQPCAEMSYRNSFLTWNSNQCNKRQHFLCKYRP